MSIWNELLKKCEIFKNISLTNLENANYWIPEDALTRIQNVRPTGLLSLGVMILGSATWYYFYRTREAKKESIIKWRSSEIIFLKFASVEYKGQKYMTPRNFLDSILHFHKKGQRRKELTEQELNYMKFKATQSGNQKHFFTKLQNHGIISYTEYVLLLSLLIKPYSAIEIAFKMLDTDDSQGIDKEEYLVIEKIFSRTWQFRRGIKYTNLGNIREEELIIDETGLQTANKIDTTLTLHFFGSDGKKVLSYETFKQFVLNLQTEILELEFHQFSRGTSFISDIDFAKLLIKYTYLADEFNYDDYIERLLVTSEKNPSRNQFLTFAEFTSFMNFLYQLDDFCTAIRYYVALNPHVSRIDFHEIFKMLPGHNLSWHLIETVFNVFDVDGTGHINYRDFITVLDDRLHRGFKVNKTKWEKFKICVRRSRQRNNRDRNPSITFYKGKSSSV